MKKILVIRRDNIGDLVCTTPMLTMLRKQYPDAWIGVLANSYNVAVLQGNPDVNAVFSYRKAKHRAANETRWSIWLETAALMWKLRRYGIDTAIIASPGGERYARMIGARCLLRHQPDSGPHEVERCIAIIGNTEFVKERAAPLIVVADSQLADTLTQRAGLQKNGGVRIAVHISARRPRQRWPASAFAALIQELLSSGQADEILVFWSPGSKDDPAHPGDDEKLSEIEAAIADPRIIPMKTHRLPELIAGLSLCDLVVCSDGGAMHLAAGLGKPVVSFFGDSDPARWHPWGVPHEVLRAQSHNVSDISVDEVLRAVRKLLPA